LASGLRRTVGVARFCVLSARKPTAPGAGTTVPTLPGRRPLGGFRNICMQAAVRHCGRSSEQFHGSRWPPRDPPSHNLSSVSTQQVASRHLKGQGFGTQPPVPIVRCSVRRTLPLIFAIEFASSQATTDHSACRKRFAHHPISIRLEQRRPVTGLSECGVVTVASGHRLVCRSGLRNMRANCARCPTAQAEPQSLRQDITADLGGRWPEATRPTEQGEAAVFGGQSTRFLPSIGLQSITRLQRFPVEVASGHRSSRPVSTGILRPNSYAAPMGGPRPPVRRLRLREEGSAAAGARKADSRCRLTSTGHQVQRNAAGAHVMRPSCAGGALEAAFQAWVDGIAVAIGASSARAVSQSSAQCRCWSTPRP
jgi:hypothetical protein